MNYLILRPYENWGRCCKVYSAHHIYTMRVRAYSLLRSFVAVMRDDEDNSEELESPAYRAYWNDGEPFIDELLSFLDASELPAMDNGQMAREQISEEDWDWLDQFDWSSYTMKWGKQVQLTHQLVLLHSDRFWYKRHFRDILDRQLINLSLFNEDGDWRRVRSLKRETFKVDMSDYER